MGNIKMKDRQYYESIRKKFPWLNERFGPLPELETITEESSVKDDSAASRVYEGKPSGYANIARLNADSGVTYRAPSQIIG